jgi:hypothetical protein
MGTVSPEIISHLDFQGTSKVNSTPQITQCFTKAFSLSRYKSFPGTILSNKEKTTLPSTSETVSKLDRVAALEPKLNFHGLVQEY